MSERIAALFGISADAPHLEEALTHPSYANEAKTTRHYQRLEFLGDAVLGLCATELLWERFPEADEGSLTRMRARIVNADALARWARAQGIADELRLGRGADATGLRQSTNLLCDVVEALIGAVYVDMGMEAARRACAQIVEPLIGTFEADVGRDPKSELQERVQKQGGDLPLYEVIDSGGPNHAPWYVVSVTVGDRSIGVGRGGSKRAAERAAARAALDALPTSEGASAASEADALDGAKEDSDSTGETP